MPRGCATWYWRPPSERSHPGVDDVGHQRRMDADLQAGGKHSMRSSDESREPPCDQRERQGIADAAPVIARRLQVPVGRLNPALKR
jgi:hypothetical protein